MKDAFKKITDKLKSFLQMFKNKHILYPTVAGIVIVIAVIIIIITQSGKRGNTSVSEENPDISGQVTGTVTEAPVISPEPSPIPTEKPVEPTPSPTPEPTPTPDPHEGQSRSLLTGEWIPDDIYALRPYCVMLNNIAVANPQSGVGDAVILYEALAEAGITRLMGVFEGLNEESSCAQRIGSVRSARHYFASFADEYDGIFVHYGETTYATKKIKKLNLDHLEGTYGIGGTVFYRDKDIAAPHNAFASVAGIKAGIAKLNIRETHNPNYTGNHFTFNNTALYPKSDDPVFNEDGRPAPHIAAADACSVILPYSSYTSPYFIYDSNSHLYTRYQFNDVHIDYNTSEPLRFTNIIIQIVHEFNKDDNGYQTMELANASGHGYYISMGECIEITWVKNEKDKFMMYYGPDGDILSINPGKTFISVFPDFKENKLSIE